MKLVSNELNLSNEEFEKKYGKVKPSLDTQIITSCRLGGRSAKVQAELQNAGYKKYIVIMTIYLSIVLFITNEFSFSVLNYSGGWTEWAKRQTN